MSNERWRFLEGQAHLSVAGCDCGFDAVEESLKYPVMQRSIRARQIASYLPDALASIM